MNTVLASNAETSGTYASKSTMVGMCARIVPKGGETMKKRKKLNFWRLLPKLTQTFMACMSVYVMHREYDKTGTISGLSLIIPLMILVYFLLLQVFEINEEGNNE
jgi:hypothetical protein